MASSWRAGFFSARHPGRYPPRRGMKNSHRRMSSVRGASLLRRLADMPGEGGADRLAHRFDVALQGREVGRLAGAGEPPLHRLGGGLRLEAAADGPPRRALAVAPEKRNSVEWGKSGSERG